MFSRELTLEYILLPILHILWNLFSHIAHVINFMFRFSLITSSLMLQTHLSCDNITLFVPNCIRKKFRL